MSTLLRTSDGWGRWQVPTVLGRYESASNTPATTVSVSTQITLPDLCVICGEPTTRRRKVTHSLGTTVKVEVKPPSLAKTFLSLAFGGLFSLFALARLTDETSRTDIVHKVSKLTAKVPQCGCTKEELRALDADHKAKQMVIAAHERFIEHCESLGIQT